MNQPNHPIDRLTHWIIRWKWPVLIGSVLFALAIGFGASQIKMENSYRVFFGKDNPQLTIFDQFQRVYTKDDNILIVVTRPGQDVFTPDYLRTIQWLTAESWKIKYATRVDSVVNFQHSYAEGDDLVVRDLVEDPVPVDPAILAGIKRVAHEEPLLKNILVGDEPDVTAVNVTLTLPGEDSMEPMVAAAAARDLKARFLERHPGYEVRLTGIVMMNEAFAAASMKDLGTLIPLMYFGMFIMMAWILRSGWGTIGTILVIFLSSLVAMGMMGWLGIPLTPPSAVSPTIIMTLAVADSIHLLVTFLHQLRQGRDKTTALRESMRVNFQPIFLTSLTTAIGFLSLNFSDAPPFRHLGNVVAIGVWAAWVFSMFFLPAFLALVPIRSRRRVDVEDRRMSGLAEWVIRHRKASLWGSVAVILVLGAAIPRIELNDQWVNYFSKSIDFRRDTDYAIQNLTGIYTVDYSVESGESSGISDPGYQAHLESFAQWLRIQPEVMQVNALTDIMKRLNKNMHEDRTEWHRLPATRELAAQYLLLFEMSLPYGLDLNNRINVDKSASRVTVTTANITTKEMRQFLARADQWQSDNLPVVMQSQATSPTVMFSYISQRNIESMLGGTLGAVVLISVILGIVLKSGRYGFLSLIPNLVPVILGFGAWAILVGSIGMSLSVVTGMTLGIVVDDTVHFLSKYLRARRQLGLSPADSVRQAFQTVGRALLATTLILVVGFGILSFSSFRLNNWMAQLTAIVIAFALIADFILLPAILMALDRWKPATKPLIVEPEMKGTVNYEHEAISA